MKFKLIILGWSFLFYHSIWGQEEPIIVEGLAQGTSYHITYYDSLNRDFYNDFEKILHDFDKSLSTYDSTSIISRINANETNVEVDQYFITCFNKAKEIWKNTNGAFDPTVYPLVNAWGYGPQKKLHIEPRIIDSILEFVGFELIELKDNRIIKKDPRVALDFNAFAQGYSVDIVAEFLNSRNISSYIVEIGGEVYAKGKMANGKSWLIGIEKPIENKETVNPIQAMVKLDKMAVATSGNYRKFTIEDGIKYGHQIDPKTGYPSKNVLLSASVFSKDCLSADANATGILVMGLDKAIYYLRNHREIQAFLIYSDEQGNYQTYETLGLQDIIINLNN